MRVVLNPLLSLGCDECATGVGIGMQEEVAIRVDDRLGYLCSGGTVEEAELPTVGESVCERRESRTNGVDVVRLGAHGAIVLG
jgi:hypothetical protein